MSGSHNSDSGSEPPAGALETGTKVYYLKSSVTVLAILRAYSIKVSTEARRNSSRSRSSVPTEQTWPIFWPKKNGGASEAVEVFLACSLSRIIRQGYFTSLGPTRSIIAGSCQYFIACYWCPCPDGPCSLYHGYFWAFPASTTSSSMGTSLELHSPCLYDHPADRSAS